MYFVPCKHQLWDDGREPRRVSTANLMGWSTAAISVATFIFLSSMWLTWTSKKLSFILHSSKWGLTLSFLQGSCLWIYYKRLFISSPKDLHIFTKYDLASCHVFSPECQRPGQLWARTGRLLSVWTPPASHQDTSFLGVFCGFYSETSNSDKLEKHCFWSH